MKDPIKYYNKEYPDVDEMVMIRIDNIGESCVNVTLMEYNIQGIIVFKELWHRRLRKRNLRQAAPIGRSMPAQVMSNRDDGSKVISLTKKRITPEETKDFSKLFSKNRKIISMIENLSHILSLDFKDLTKKIIHKLNEKYIENNEYDFDSIHDLMETYNDDFSYLDFLDLDANLKENFIDIIQKNFKVEDIKLSVKIALVSNSPQGINTVKEILLKHESENPDINMYLDTSPYYIFETVTTDLNKYKKKLNDLVSKTESDLLANNCKFKLIEKSY